MKQLTISFLLIILTNCSTPVNEKFLDKNTDIDELEFPVSIDVVSALKNEGDFTLSEFGDSITYLLLKGLPEVPIVFVLDLEITSDNIFVFASHRTGIVRFSKEGELINRIGKYGNGPGELSLGSRFSLSHEEEMIYVQRNYTYNVLGFTYDGQFKGVLITDEEKLGAYTYPLSADRILRLGCIHSAPEYIPEGLYELAIFDKANNVVTSIPTELENTKQWRSGPTIIRGHRHYSRSPTWFENRFHYKAFSSDTVYEASLDSIYPKYIMDKGNFGPPPEAYGIVKKGSYGDPDQFIFSECIFESAYYLLFRAFFQGDDYIVRMNKLSGELESIKCIGCAYYSNLDVDFDIKIKNDIDGGVNFYPHFTNRAGDIWIYTISPMDYIQQLDKMAETGKINLDDRSLEPVRIYHSISEDDNPLLIFLHLKK